MLRKLILLDAESGEEFVFPVTPPGYQLSEEMVMQTVEVFGVGDYAMPTYARLNPIVIEKVLLPVQAYPFCVAYRHADDCLAWLSGKRDGKRRLRFIVSGTPINRLVYVQAVSGGEYDGTNDWSGSVTLQPCITLRAPQVQDNRSQAAQARPPVGQQVKAGTYKVKSGDTLWGIAKQFYGDGGLCYKLAACNGIKNANLICVGQVLKLPDAATLGKTAPVAATATKPTPPKAPAQGKQTMVMVTIQAKGQSAYCGRVNFNYIDTGRKCSGNGGIATYPHILRVSAGTEIQLSWKGKDGHSWSAAYVDGAAQTATGGKCAMTATQDRTLCIEWVR